MELVCLLLVFIQNTKIFDRVCGLVGFGRIYKEFEEKIEIWNCLCLDHTPSVDANLGLFGRGTSNSAEVCLAWSCEDKRSKRTLSTSNT